MSNDFLSIAGGGSANVLSQAQYAALTTLLANGYQAGTAASNQMNKTWRQSSIMSKVIGDLIADITGQNVVDDGTTATILSNLMAAITRAGYVDDTGAVNAYVATLSPGILAYYDGMQVSFSTVNANTTTNPTLNVSGLGAITITNPGGGALFAGQIAANTVTSFVYNSTGPRFELTQGLTVTQGDTRYVKSSAPIQPVTCVASANTLISGLNATTIDFHSATLPNGVPDTITIASALSLTTPTGATLGATNAIAARLYLLCLNNAGTPELAITNAAGGLNLDETGLISTTAMSAGATSASVIYSTTARTNVPYRVVGFADVTEATAGTYATQPTLVQGAGGNALTAMSSLGYGQKWTNVTGSRSQGTTYYNTTGKPILVSIYALYSTSNITLYVNGITIGFGTGTGTGFQLSAIVPPGGYYSAVVTSGAISGWAELR